jgi:hypothetical protein
LPGLRELRAPLISGCLWLFLGWLVLGGLAPTRHDAHGAIKHAFELGHLISDVGSVVVVSALAYLFGSIMLTVQDRAMPLVMAVFEPCEIGLPGGPKKQSARLWVSRAGDNLLSSLVADGYLHAKRCEDWKPFADRKQRYPLVGGLLRFRLARAGMC